MHARMARAWHTGARREFGSRVQGTIIKPQMVHPSMQWSRGPMARYILRAVSFIRCHMDENRVRFPAGPNFFVVVCFFFGSPFYYLVMLGVWAAMMALVVIGGSPSRPCEVCSRLLRGWPGADCRRRMDPSRKRMHRFRCGACVRALAPS